MIKPTKDKGVEIVYEYINCEKLMLLQNSYKVILLLLTLLLPLNWFQIVSFQIGINKDKINVKLSQRSKMEPFCVNSETLLAFNSFSQKTPPQIFKWVLNTSLNKKKFFYIRIFERPRKHASTQARKAREHPSTPSKRFSRLMFG